MGRASVRRPASCGSPAATRPRPRALTTSAISTTAPLPPVGRSRRCSFPAAGAQHARPQHLRQPGRRQLRHDPGDRQRLHLRHPDRHLHHQQRSRRGQHHRLWRLRQQDRRRLRRSDLARLHLQSGHRDLHDLQRARLGRHPFRGHHRRPVAPIPSTWSPIRSTRWAVSMPGRFMSTLPGSRPGRKSPCPARA